MFVLAKSLEPRQVDVEREPFRVGCRRRVVDVEVGHTLAHECPELGLEQRRRPAGERLDVQSDSKPGPTRRPHHGRQPCILHRAGPPPRHDHRADSERGDLAHLRADDPWIRGRVRPPRREPAGSELRRRRVAVLLPVLPRAVTGLGAVPGVVEDGDVSHPCARRRFGPAGAWARGAREERCGRRRRRQCAPDSPQGGRTLTSCRPDWKRRDGPDRDPAAMTSATPRSDAVSRRCFLADRVLNLLDPASDRRAVDMNVER